MSEIPCIPDLLNHLMLQVRANISWLKPKVMSRK